METDTRYMERALDLAKLGLGKVAPNPMVGAVIVHQNRIIGEGFHQFHGGPHAEVNAITSVEDKSLLKESTIYINLEPCNHTGLTPPCTDLILDYSIPRVVISQVDPNPLVEGKGVKRLLEKGVDIKLGILEHQARELNRRFNTFHEKKRPFIMLKWAQTKDGFVDILREKNDLVKPKWITDEYCRRIVHKWRSEEAAILVGTDTALKDDPKLNVRLWTGKNPIRIVLDRHLRLPESLSLLDGSIPTLVYTATERMGKKNVDYVKVDFDGGILESILKDLHLRGIQSVIIEGGPKLLNSFLKKDLWDEARVFRGPMNFHEGVAAPEFPFEPVQQQKTGTSILEIFRNGDL